MKGKFDCNEADYLFRAVLSLKTQGECRAFFEDLCTFSELMSMTQRINVAKLLSEGATQSEITGKTGASSATISRVNRTFLYGNDAYKMVFSRIENEGGMDGKEYNENGGEL